MIGNTKKMRVIQEKGELISFEYLLKNKLKLEGVLELASRKLKLMVMNILGK